MRYTPSIKYSYYVSEVTLDFTASIGEYREAEKSGTKKFNSSTVQNSQLSLAIDLRASDRACYRVS